MTAKVIVSFPEERLAEVDRIAEEEHRSRSELLREAMRLYIETRGSQRRPGDDRHVQAAVAVQNALAHLASSSGEDSTADVRRWREARRRSHCAAPTWMDILRSQFRPCWPMS